MCRFYEHDGLFLGLEFIRNALGALPYRTDDAHVSSLYAVLTRLMMMMLAHPHSFTECSYICATNFTTV